MQGRLWFDLSAHIIFDDAFNEEQPNEYVKRLEKVIEKYVKHSQFTKKFMKKFMELFFLIVLEFKQIQPRYVCFRDLQQNAR